jgi:hypothetical protein
MLKEPTSRYRSEVAVLLAVIVGGVLGCSSRGTPATSACQQNNDCVTSPDAVNHRAQCFQDIYCLMGVCHWECHSPCQPQRTDVNPCPNEALCAPAMGSLDKSTEWCFMTPIDCNTVADCPSYTPPIDAGSPGVWTCENGVCAYPNLQYATR